MRWSMSEGMVSDFEWWWWLDQSDIRWRACVVTVSRLNRYEVTQIRRLSSIENFVGKWERWFYIQFVRSFKPVKRFQNRSDVFEFWSLDNSYIKHSDMMILNIFVTSFLFCLNCTKFDELILGKIITTVAIRCQILRLKCTKFDFDWGSAPDPAGGAYSAPPDPLAGIQGRDTVRSANVFLRLR